jgi:hypothetical protein
MSSPESLSYKSHLGEELKSRLQMGSVGVLRGARDLIDRGGLVDDVDKKIVGAALEFMQNPSESLEDIMKQSRDVSEVLCGFQLQGADTPPEVDAVYNYLMTLQGANRICFIEAKLEEGLDVDSPEIQQVLTTTMGWATVIARDCKDDTLMKALQQLKEEMKSV